MSAGDGCGWFRTEVSDALRLMARCLSSFLSSSIVVVASPIAVMSNALQ